MKISVFYHHIVEAAKQVGCTEEEILKKIKEVGITAVELDRDDTLNPDKLLELLKRNEFSVSSIYGFYDFSETEDLENCKKHIKLAMAMEADKIMIVPGFYSKTDESARKRELEQMIEGTRKLCKMAEANGMRVTIEDFDDEKSPLCSISGMGTFLDEIPSLYVTLDTGNFIISGEDELEAFEKLKNKVIHVHCKDRAYDENGNICPISVGKGFIKMSEVLEELSKMHYDGYLAIEHFGAENYLEFMIESAKWIRRKVEV